jgi:hypothetical protein
VSPSAIATLANAEPAASSARRRVSLGRFTFTFCPRCGSTVFYVEEGDEEHIAIPVGAFADARFVSPTVSVFEERRHSWVSLPEDVEKHWRNP